MRNNLLETIELLMLLIAFGTFILMLLEYVSR